MLYLNTIEDDRELSVRDLCCPVCHAPPREQCVYGTHPNSQRPRYSYVSHTGRYNRAARAGLVPKMAGAR